MNVGDDHVHAGLHDAQGTTREHGSLVIQAAHQHLDALVDLTQNIFCRHLTAFKHQFTGV